MIARPRIAKKSVVSVAKFHANVAFPRLSQRIGNSARLLGTDVLILAAPNQKHRRVNVFHASEQTIAAFVRRDAAAIKRDGGINGECQRRKKGNAAAQAKSNHRYREIRAGAIRHQESVRRAQIGLETSVRERAHVWHRTLKIVVLAVKVLHRPVIELGTDREIALAGKSLGDVANVG